MNLNPRQKSVDVGYDPGQQVQATPMEPVSNAMQLHRVEARVTEDDLQHAAGGGIPFEDDFDVPFQLTPPVHRAHLHAMPSIGFDPLRASHGGERNERESGRAHV